MENKYITAKLNEIYDRHDVYCNQKYGENDDLPYSFHLKMVVAVAKRFIHLTNINSHYSVIIGAGGHDLIEDARMSYNDVLHSYGLDVAEIVFLCTETRGRDRKQRHSDLFFATLKDDRLAVFVKLCDIVANATYSRVMGSSMHDKYIKEFNHLKDKLYVKDEYEPLWNELKLILS